MSMRAIAKASNLVLRGLPWAMEQRGYLTIVLVFKSMEIRTVPVERWLICDVQPSIIQFVNCEFYKVVENNCGKVK